MLQKATTWVLPVIFAVTFHEAAHGFVAYRFGDDTARRAGRMTLNPLKHIDPFGTVLLPALLLIMKSGFLFGYAKPVPVNFGRLRHPRRDMVWVALAGPLMNILLAIASALLAYLVVLMPDNVALWGIANVKNSMYLNILLCVFNMLPLPPLDGGRVAVGILPRFLAMPLARLEPYGMLILMMFFIISYAGFNLFNLILGPPFEALYRFVLMVTGHSW